MHQRIFWVELMFVLNHGTQYAIYVPYIQRIINYKTDIEFSYYGKHGAYQPHVIRGPAVLPPPPPPAAATAMGLSAIALASPPVQAPSTAPESSCAATHRGKKQNVLFRGFEILISMCCSNDALIRESHQQMSHMLSTLEERQHEMHASMGFETSSPSSVHLYLLQLWEIRGHGITTPVKKTKMTMKATRSRKNRSKYCCFSFSLFGV
jgi:hypothetical protein